MLQQKLTFCVDQEGIGDGRVDDGQSAGRLHVLFFPELVGAAGERVAHGTKDRANVKHVLENVTSKKCESTAQK